MGRSDYSTVAVIIPALNPPDRMAGFLDELITFGYRHIILVDDGSSPAFAGAFDAADQHPEITVLRHAVNAGKGRALKTAYDHVLQTMPDVVAVVTADSDGQHTPHAIAAVADRLLANHAQGRDAAVLGVRNFHGPGIPPKSRFGNRLTSRMVAVLFGRYLQDTQTGLRGFPVGQLPGCIAIRGERFEYEMNALLALINQRIPVDEVEIETIYHDSTNSETHFRPLRDSMRIYAIILTQFLTFIGSSTVAALFDFGLYSLIIWSVFDSSHAVTAIAVSTTVARVVSSLANYAANRYFIFREADTDHASLVRYYILAAAVMVLSITGTSLLASLFQGHVVYAKLITDTLLFLLSFVAQKRWVFRDRSLQSH